MKKIKLTKEKKLQDKINELNNTIYSMTANTRRHLSIIEQINTIMEGNKSYHNINHEELPREVMKLKLFREQHEGAIHPAFDVIGNQREIIRWLINPETANQADEIKRLKDPNFRMRGISDF